MSNTIITTAICSRVSVSNAVHQHRETEAAKMNPSLSLLLTPVAVLLGPVKNARSDSVHRRVSLLHTHTVMSTEPHPDDFRSGLIKTGGSHTSMMETKKLYN